MNITLNNYNIYTSDDHNTQVTENAKFIEDLGADSLDQVELVMAFEEEFKCEMPDEAAEKIITVGRTENAKLNLIMNNLEIN